MALARFFQQNSGDDPFHVRWSERIAIRCWLRWAAKSLAIVSVSTIASTSYTGCLWLAVPGLAYQGYMYEHQSDTRSSTAATSESSGEAGSESSASQPSPRDNSSIDHSIE
jgi:hypothetical protein